ncbi:methyltransferase domain-containing protein [Aromatoleum bremense]|uniref:Malonyl-[acyl-carrier protein] O-methyltransferase n=1 Tax=Aromatoleum bremense TaxID=76115 RepID=A0ABX1NYG6_9RHOO|nr:methyltransferase domain-containing protein [Aromatoleum bremense]NMG17007.1 methyltransferase domain-containing protein [Aromatoleum bremense]QTQ33594.1 Malonyl- [acyl carrier protein] O-methyltransferase [Aromatoleum bremense]
MVSRTVPKHAVRRAFDRAAATYDSAAAVQREICHRLAEFAAPRLASAPPLHRVVDAGCGTGYGLDLLARLCPQATLIALDFAPAMLARLAAVGPEHARPVPLCADLEALPLAGGSIDAVWSSLALQWCEPALALGEFARVLRPGGEAWIATLGPRTLWELRDAFATVDDAEHAIRFHPSEHWIAEAVAAGFEPIADDNFPVFAVAPDLRQLLRDIKSIGAHSLGAQRRREPLGRAAWKVLETRYETHRRDDGLLPATYDLILLALRKPAQAAGCGAGIAAATEGSTDD